MGTPCRYSRQESIKWSLLTSPCSQPFSWVDLLLERFPEETMRADSGKSQSQQRNDSAIVLQQTAGNTVLTGQTQSKASET